MFGKDFPKEPSVLKQNKRRVLGELSRWARLLSLQAHIGLRCVEARP